MFEHGSFAPQAKIVGDKTYSIICDYLGTPVQAFNDQGENVWARELDIYGATREETGNKNFIPFTYQGQYLDSETNLAYNRYRYYSSDTGGYISQDPIGLEGGDNLYAYVHDVNAWIDPFGLNLVNGIPQNPGVVRRFMSKKEYKAFKKNGFKYNPKDSRGGISTTSTKIKPRNPDAIKRSTGALGADYYVDIDTKGKNVELKGMTKGGVPDWKIKDDVNVDIKDKNGNIIKNGDIVGSGKVCKS
ncbi:RHS repeat-associated core domain-containing protein [uncultured Algibacter sp.]|uniref:RHS repeat domain-containing protein n=1 Tax=uncultured Algibacter sp. TaxID=298659 RepID=UPI0032173E43